MGKSNKKSRSEYDINKRYDRINRNQMKYNKIEKKYKNLNRISRSSDYQYDDYDEYE